MLNYQVERNFQQFESGDLFDLYLKYQIFAHPYLRVIQEPVAVRAEAVLIVGTH